MNPVDAPEGTAARYKPKDKGWVHRLVGKKVSLHKPSGSQLPELNPVSVA